MTQADKTAAKINENLDTNLLKIIAIISMVIDHVHKAFFPENQIMAVLGRISFPLIAYCVVVGCLYTRNIKRYMLRLGIFAVITQSLFLGAYVITRLTAQSSGMDADFLNLNILFTLLLGVIAIYALSDLRKRWFLLPLLVLFEWLVGVDYGLYGIGLIVLFYLMRERPRWLSACTIALWMLAWGLGDYFYIGPLGLDLQAFALLSLPLIYIHTNLRPRLNKYFFYIFYPAHFMILALLRVILGL
ncbi:MAG: TraX family protein [Lachnospiraceae bacterium]